MIGVPPPRDVDSFVEALQVGASIAKILNAPAVHDVETGQLLSREIFEEQLYYGRSARKERMLVSSTNPPQLLGVSSSVTSGDQSIEGSRTLGMRKLGLPDVLLEDWLPGNSDYWVFDIFCNLLLSGKAPTTAGSSWSIHTDEPEVASALHGSQQAGRSIEVTWLDGDKDGNEVWPHSLAIGFAGGRELQPYERHALFSEAFWGSDYPALPPAKARELMLAVARAKTKVRELRDRFKHYRETGTRIFVVSHVDWLVEKKLGIYSGNPIDHWGEVVKWSGDGYTNTILWDDDPRSGGKEQRYQTPAFLAGQLVEEESDDYDYDDVLLIDAQGTVTGGEVIELVNGLRAPLTK